LSILKFISKYIKIKSTHF